MIVCVRTGIGKHRVRPGEKKEEGRYWVENRDDKKTESHEPLFRTAFGSHFKAFDGSVET